MDTAVLTTIVSAVVSLTVTLITVFVSKSSIKAERDKLERELQRSMTAKLYDARLESYPRAMEITEGLRKSRLAEQRDRLSQAYFRTILEELDQWHATKAAFIVSRSSLERLWDLREQLRQKPGLDGGYSSEQLQNIVDAKGRFRRSLWSDMQLLFKEDTQSKVEED
jgi:hypothetical protein